TPVRIDITIVKPSTPNESSTRVSGSNGRKFAAIFGTIGTTYQASSAPAMPAMTLTSKLSKMKSRTTLRREAPIAMRNAISRRSPDPRERQVRPNADNRVWHTVQRNAAADYIRVAAEAFAPEVLRHHRHIRGFFFLRQKVAPADRSDAEHIEVVRRHLPAEDL